MNSNLSEKTKSSALLFRAQYTDCVGGPAHELKVCGDCHPITTTYRGRKLTYIATLAPSGTCDICQRDYDERAFDARQRVLDAEIASLGSDLEEMQ